jgi:hypothetical protein
VTEPPPTQRPAWHVDVVVAVGAVLALVAVWFGNGDAPRPFGFPLDDAWIHMVYGANLAEHGLLAYNSGVAATGATSPLWAVLVGLAHVLGAGDVDRTVVNVYVLGAALQVTTVVLLARLVLASTGSRIAAIIGGVIGALSGSLAAAAFSGMEVTLTAALLMGSVLACQRQAWGWAGLWLGLAGLARPEAAVVSMACFAYVAWTTRTLSRRDRVLAHVRLIWPSLVFGAVVVVYALVATGRPMPATFYVKQANSLADLPGRIHVAFGGLLGDVSPLQTGLAYVFVVGLVAPGVLRPRGSRARLLLPAAAALAFLLANLALIPPRPHVFYHLRYLLPAVPLLLAAIAIGAHELGRLAVLERIRHGSLLPLGILAALGLFESATSLRDSSRRLHNDTRNIEEVQRALGVWVEQHTAPGSWIATGDAGAVRYFSKRDAVDVMGLNTPELYWEPGTAWSEQHPVSMFVFLPCWFRPLDESVLQIIASAKTEHYTVTSLACMDTQVIVSCRAKSTLRFTGMRQFAITCDPAGLRL